MGLLCRLPNPLLSISCRVLGGVCLALCLSGVGFGQVGHIEKTARALAIPGEVVETGDYLVLPDGAPGNVITATQVTFTGIEDWASWSPGTSIEVDDKNRKPIGVSEIKGASGSYLVLTDRPAWGVLDMTRIVVVEGVPKLERQKYRFQINKDKPPPEPDDPDDPDPPGPDDGDLDEAPIDGDGLRVLFIYESSERMAETIEASFFSQEVERYLNANCEKVDGKADFRRLDPDAKFTDPNHRFAKALRRPRNSLPWLIISNGETGYEGEFPDTVQKTLDLIQRFTPTKAVSRASVSMISIEGCEPCRRFQVQESKDLNAEFEVIKRPVTGLRVSTYPTFIIRCNGQVKMISGFAKAKTINKIIEGMQ